jgi:hypothetical protein
MFKSFYPRPAAGALLAATLSAVVLAAPLALLAPARAAETTGAARIESHLQDMHAKLHISADQEDQWKVVAQAMRDNEAAIAPLIQQRKAAASKMNALDDLDSYTQISSTHVEGIKNFTKAFTVLYGAMTPAQKSDADALFRNGIPAMAKAK